MKFMIMSTNKNDPACGKVYNVEWYLGNGKLQTTSATLENIGNGYFYFVYPSGGLFIVEQKAIRSIECTGGKIMNNEKKCSNCKHGETCATNYCDAVWDRAYNIKDGKDCWTPK
jgi:hypothetical protein